MKAAILTKIKHIEIREIPIPRIKPNEALVRIKSVGVCGSDVHYFLRGRIGNIVVKGPQILGHEASGEVVKVGDRVKKIKPGTRVAVEPGVPCGKCEYCLTQRYNLCPRIKFFGTYPVPGAYREYVAMPESALFPLPDSMSLDEGAMVEPLAVGVYASQLGEIKKGQSIAVLGMGSIGLVTLQCALVKGAGVSYVADLLPNRLALASKYGDDWAINVKKQDPVNTILQKTKGKGVDVAFESAGQPETFQQCLEITKPGGLVVLIGICEEEMIPLNMSIARRKGLTIKMVRRFRYTYPTAIDLVKKGKVDVQFLVTHHFPLEQIENAFNLVHQYRDGVIKAVITL